MKSKGKVDKTSNLNILKLNLEQIYTRPFQKPSNRTFSAKNSASNVNKQVPETRLDSDTSRNLHTSPSMYLAQTGRSIPDNESLLQFSSKLQDSFHSVQQYLKGFKGSAINQLNFDDLGAFVYDSKSPGLNSMLFDNDIGGARKVTDTATATMSTLSQTLGSASRFLGKNINDTHTQSFTARTPNKKPMFVNSPNMRKLVLTHRTDTENENSEAELTERTDTQDPLPSGRRPKTKISNSAKLNEGKKTVDFQRRRKKSPTAPGTDDYRLEQLFDKGKKTNMPILRKKREFTIQLTNSENQEDLGNGEDFVVTRKYNDKEMQSEGIARKPLIQRSKTETGGFRNKLKSEKKFSEEMKTERPGSSSQLLKAKRKERINNIENGIENNKGFELENETSSKPQGLKESHNEIESSSGFRFNILKLDLASLEENEEEEVKAEDASAQAKNEEQILDKVKNFMTNVNLLGVASEVLFQKGREATGQVVPSLKLPVSPKAKEMKVEGSNTDRKEKIKKTFKKTVRAVRIGRTFLNSVAKKQSASTPRAQLKARNFSLDATSPKKANETPAEVVYTFTKKEKASNTQIPLKIVVTKNPSPPKEAKEESPTVATQLSKKGSSPSSKGSKNGSGSGSPRLNKKDSQEPDTIPMIRVLASANGVVLVDSSKSNSRRASKIEDASSLSALINEGSPKLRKSVIAGNAKSWFDFSSKPVQKKMKKLRSMRTSQEFSTSKIFQDNQIEFVAAFNSTLRNTNRQLLNSSLIKISEDNEQVTKGVGRQISKKASNPLEELLKLDDDDSGTPGPEKKGTLESDGKMQVAHQQSGPYSIKQSTIIGKEEYGRESLKMYSRRDDVIIININPPIEEVSSKMEETASPLTFSPARSLIERLESSENLTSDKNGAVVRFTYDLHTRKHIEEDDDSSLVEEFGRGNVLDQSFRNKTEELFKYDEIYKSTMDNFNTKSQRLRVRSNFFSFVERCIVIPTERWAHVELINNYVLYAKKEASSLTCIHVNLNTFEYTAKNFVLHSNPFIDPLIFLLTTEHLHSEDNIRRRRHTDSLFEEDDTEKERSRLKSSTLVFGSGEVLIPKSILEGFSDDYKRILSFKPLIVQINFQTILKMKEHFFNYTYYGTPGENFELENASIRYSLSMVLSTLNKENWLYLYRCIHKMYKNELYGFFEYKEGLDGSEKMVNVKEVEEKSEINETIPEIKQTKKRDLMVAGGLWRSSSNVAFLARTPRKTVTDIGGNFTSHLMNLANAVEERKEEEEEDYKPEQNLGDNMKQQERPRRYSKTSVKPLSHSNTQQNQQNKPNMSAIEKSITAFVEATAKNKDLLSSILPKGASSKVPKISHIDSTADQTGKLQIPRKNSNRQAASNSPRSHQEIKPEATEKRTKRPPTITHSLTPSSDQSSPHREDNAINLNNQSTLGAQFNRERTKTRLEVSRGSTIRRDPSYGATSQTREKEETAQHILWALQPKPKEENNVKPIHVVTPRRERGQSIKELEKSPVLHSIPDVRRTRIDLVTEIRKPKVKKQKQQDSLEKFLFDAVYAKKFMEIKESLAFYPKEIVHIRDHEMNTLLIEAARMGYKEIVELLLNQGSDPNAQNKQGNTALHIALAYQHFKVADLLVKHGARQNIMNNKGKTAWDEGGY